MAHSFLEPQPWDWPGPRVLVERPFGAGTSARVDALRRSGYAVLVCPGPTADERCPLAHEDRCAAATGADAIVSALDPGRPETCEVVAALRRRLPRVPLLLETELPELTPQQLAGRVGELLDRA